MSKATYTVKEVAKLLGFSTNTVYKYLENGSIKASRFGIVGRFRIPAAEVEKILQQQDKHLQNSSLATVSELQASPNIFDWFVGFLSMGLGFSQFVNPVYTSILPSLAKFLPYLNIAHVLLFIGGAFLLGFDVFKIAKGRKHAILNFSMGVLYLVLAGIFMSQKSVLSAGYLSLSAVLLVSSFIYLGNRLQYLIFINILFALIGLGVLVWPDSSAFASLFRVGTLPRNTFLIIWTAFTFTFLFLSFMAIRKDGRFAKITSFLVGAVALIYSVISFTSGFWGRSVFGITLGTFSFVYPFMGEFGTFKTRTRKEAMISFLWLLGVFFIGSIMLRMFYRSFQKVILDEMGRKASLASEITKNYMDRNVATLQAFINDGNFVKLLDGGNLATLDSELKQIYLSSNNSFVRLVVADSQGKVIDTYPLYLKSQNVDISKEAYFTKPAESENTYVTELVESSVFGTDPTVMISLPITDSHDNFRGLILGLVDTKALQKQLEEIGGGKVGSLVIMDSDGSYILNPDSREGVVRASSRNGESNVIYDQEGVLSFETSRTVDTYGWAVLATQQQSATIEVYSLMGFGIFLFFVVTTVGSLTLVMFLRKTKNN